MHRSAGEATFPDHSPYQGTLTGPVRGEDARVGAGLHDVVRTAPAPAPYVVIDLEATCSPPGGPVPYREMETIEIGAVILDGATLAPQAEFTTLVRPFRHPTLTAFCTALTTITQAEVDKAPSFMRAMLLLERFLTPFPGARFASWGEYDRVQLDRDADYYQSRLPLAPGHTNLKRLFERRFGQKYSGKYGVEAALRQVAMQFTGTPHRALDDARNIARLVPWCEGAK